MTRVDMREVALDVVAVVVFVAAGRLQHGASDAFRPLGALNTLWPFIGGLVVAVLVAVVAAAGYAAMPTGAAVAVITAVCGLALRYASGQGIAVSFAVVSILVLAALMLGWRAVRVLVGRS